MQRRHLDHDYALGGRVSHCLLFDLKRQRADCIESTPAPIADATNVHECVNWDAINSWAGERVFDPFQPNYLVHPTLGMSIQFFFCYHLLEGFQGPPVIY